MTTNHRPYQGEVRLAYRNNYTPYGIRDDSGFLFFFRDIHKYSGQDERYREEIEEQQALADYLLKALKEFKLC